MRTTYALVLAAALAAPWNPCSAEPLTATAAVQAQPDPAAPILGYLSAGTEPTLATAPTPNLPPGWIAVQLPGPFNGYVSNQDLTKGLDVRPGAPIRLEPKPDAGVLVLAAKGDKIEITGLYGKWTQVKLDRTLVGYVQTGSPPTAVPVVGGTAAPAPAAAPVSAPPAETQAAGQPVPASADVIAAPRFFDGRFASTHRVIGPRRPYPWQLEDPSGARIAYLDISGLLLTDQIQDYIDRPVVVYGPMKALPGGKDIVIEVESLRLQ